MISATSRGLVNRTRARDFAVVNATQIFVEDIVQGLALPGQEHKGRVRFFSNVDSRLNVDVGVHLNVGQNAAIGNDLDVARIATVGGVTIDSDPRLKSQVRLVNASQADKLSELRVCAYEKCGRLEYGVMSTNVSELYPELVSVSKRGFDSVDYNSLLCLLLRKVQMLESQIKSGA